MLSTFIPVFKSHSSHTSSSSQAIGQLVTYVHRKNKNSITNKDLEGKEILIFNDFKFINKLFDNLKDNLLNKITSIIFSNNDLTKLPKLPPNLISLKCSSNKITQLPEELPLSLKKLDCSYNKITKLPEKLPSNLVELDCSYNQITELPKELPSNLEKLDCSYNQITELPKKLPINLVELNCGYNKIINLENLPFFIQKLDILFNTKLEKLDIPNNTKTLELILDSYQFEKFKETLREIKKYRFLKLKIYHIESTKKFTVNHDEGFSTSISHQKPSYINKLPENYKKNIIKNYNLHIIQIIEGGSKTVKNSKNPKKINMKKSELQKIALKNKVSLKKRDGTMKKKDELIKSLKLIKIL